MPALRSSLVSLLALLVPATVLAKGSFCTTLKPLEFPMGGEREIPKVSCMIQGTKAEGKLPTEWIFRPRVLVETARRPFTQLLTLDPLPMVRWQYINKRGLLDQINRQLARVHMPPLTEYELKKITLERLWFAQEPQSEEEVKALARIISGDGVSTGRDEGDTRPFTANEAGGGV